MVDLDEDEYDSIDLVQTADELEWFKFQQAKEKIHSALLSRTSDPEWDDTGRK